MGSGFRTRRKRSSLGKDWLGVDGRLVHCTSPIAWNRATNFEIVSEVSSGLTTHMWGSRHCLGHELLRRWGLGSRTDPASEEMGSQAREDGTRTSSASGF